MIIKPPITWFGSKARLARQIIAHFPEHRTYCEPFGGSAAVLFAKDPIGVEVYNDLDGDLVNLFRVLRTPSLYAELEQAVGLTLYARAEFELAKDAAEDPVERARRFFVRQRQSHGGLGQQWSYCLDDTVQGISSAVRRWQSGIERLPAVHQRLRSVQIEQDDWRAVMRRYDRPGTLFYLDPPYIPETRVNGRYEHELSADDHRQFVRHLLGELVGMAVLSGYAHEAYKPLEDAGWARVDFDVPTHASRDRSRRTECLWLSPLVVRAAKQMNLFS